jgi:hypothetical protein
VTLLAALTVNAPTPEVAPWPVTDTFAAAVVVGDPTPADTPLITGTSMIAAATI